MINFVMDMCIIKMAIPPRKSSVRRAKVSLYLPMWNRQKISIKKKMK